MDIKKEILAYTAGFLDGEGSIQINQTFNGKRYYWGLTVNIANNNYEILDELRTAFGGIGSLRSYKTRGTREDRLCSRWSLYSNQAEQLLESVLPFLRIKKPQAEVALKFRKHTMKIESGMNKGLSPEAKTKRTELALLIRELNAKNGKATVKDIYRVAL